MTYTLQQLSDRQDLLELGVQFAQFADHEITTAPCAQLFAADGIFDVNGAENVGTEAIETFLDQMRQGGFSGPKTGTRHLIFNAQVSLIDEGSAVGVSEWLLISPATEDMAGVSIAASGRYLDKYSKTAGSWAIARRTVAFLGLHRI